MVFDTVVKKDSHVEDFIVVLIFYFNLRFWELPLLVLKRGFVLEVAFFRNDGRIRWIIKETIFFSNSMIKSNFIKHCVPRCLVFLVTNHFLTQIDLRNMQIRELVIGPSNLWSWWQDGFSRQEWKICRIHWSYIRNLISKNNSKFKQRECLLYFCLNYIFKISHRLIVRNGLLHLNTKCFRPIFSIIRTRIRIIFKSNLVHEKFIV